MPRIDANELERLANEIGRLNRFDLLPKFLFSHDFKEVSPGHYKNDRLSQQVIVAKDDDIFFYSNPDELLDSGKFIDFILHWLTPDGSFKITDGIKIREGVRAVDIALKFEGSLKEDQANSKETKKQQN